jgi:hypothetical protein
MADYIKEAVLYKFKTDHLDVRLTAKMQTLSVTSHTSWCSHNKSFLNNKKGSYTSSIVSVLSETAVARRRQANWTPLNYQ